MGIFKDMGYLKKLFALENVYALIWVSKQKCFFILIRKCSLVCVPSTKPLWKRRYIFCPLENWQP